MKKEIKLVLISLRQLYRNVLGIKEGTDIPSTIEGIKRDISFRGHSAWILIFSIFIASIGLNINSVAVIIGAMLISPLMGPIVGIGLSVGTNDIETLGRSLKNLGIAVAISLFTSTMYFLITPLTIEQTELLARTKPTILDVLVALFGGFAGIVAGSRKEKSNVIPGVAIATALMPPLCTAGYGLATLKLSFFLGAFYLFFINSVFISLSTFLVVRYLKFPLVKYIDSFKIRRYRLYLFSFLIITILPSTIIFYQVIQETRFKLSSENFIREKGSFQGTELINYKITYADSVSRIDLYYIGKTLNEDKKLFLRNAMSDYGLTSDRLFAMTKKINLRIHQEEENSVDFDKKFNEFNNDLRLGILKDLYTKNEEIIQDKDLKIKLLENEVFKLRNKDTLPYAQLMKEMEFHFKEIEKFSYGKNIEVTSINDSIAYDTLSVFMLKFNSKINSSVKKKAVNEVKDWLQIRLSDTTIKALAY